MRGRAALFLALAALAAAACAAPGARSPGSQTGPAPRSRAEVWITVRDFRQVLAVAASDRVVYLGTTAGLERWDSLREAWLTPITSADDLPDDQVTALAVDRFGTDVWVGTRRGLARIAFDDAVETVWGPPPATVSAILLDPRDGRIHALVGGAWWTGRGGSLERERRPPPAGLEGPARAEDLDPASVPWIDPLYTRSMAFDGLFRLTRVDRDARGDWYAGTWGDNGRRWPATGGAWAPLYYGLAGPGGGPLARMGDGVWFVPRSEVEGSSGARAALAFAEAGLERWSYVVPRSQPALPAAAWRDAEAAGDTLLLAGDMGLAWGVGPQWRDAGWERDLGPALAVAVDGPIAWVGTERGLVAWDRLAGRVAASALAPHAVTAIAVARDAVFAGGADGLWAARRAAPPAGPEDAAAVADALVPVEPAARSVRALALHGTLLVVASDHGVEAFDRATGAWRAIGDAAPRALPLALASDGENVWVGMEAGLARWRSGTGEWRTYGPGDGLPAGPVMHLLAGPDAVWASTPSGATRFAWRAAEP